MSDGALTLLDGTHLRAAALEVTLPPDSDVCFTGAQLLELADSAASSSLFGLPSLPESVKSAALSRLHADPGSFRCTDFSREQALSKLQDYIAAIADELQDDPLVVAILDGKTLRLFLEDEDDFAMLAEDLFTDLDTEDKGKISKNEIRSALLHMGVEMGIPPFSEFPLLNDILKKYGAEGEEELGQAQFAQVLQPILQELADALSEKHVVLVQNIKVINGSKLRKLLANDQEINDIVEKISNEKDKKDEPTSIKMVRGFLEKNGMDLGLPPLKAGEVVVLLYDSVFSDVEDPKEDARSDEKSVILFKNILGKFLEQLENSPVFYDVDN